MKAISNNDLKKILRKHVLWFNNDPEGEKADLRWADLRGANLKRAKLMFADLYKADLSKANLKGADLTGADLRWANLKGVNLKGVNLKGANLYGANLYGANLKGANLYEADLSEAYLGGVKNLSLPIVAPEKGSFIGYKKCRDDLIVELEIPEDSLRSSATTRKCRCSKAKVLSITNLDGSKSKCTEATSKRDSSFVYKVGETVEVTNFDPNRWNECSTGIHFFVTREEAEKYTH